MPFRPCPSGCGCFLSADDGHDRCLQCLGLRHAEAAFVDDSCVCCGRMSMISLRSRLSFMKGLAPSAATRADLSGSSRGSPADALGDLRVTVRASPPGTSPRTSYSSRSEHPVRFPGDFAGLSHGAPSISFGAPSVDRMSIAASGDGFTSSEDEGAVGLPPTGVVATAALGPELTAMLARAAVSIGLEVNRSPSPEPSRLDDCFSERGAAHHHALLRCLSSWRCMRSWQSRGWPLSRPEAARPPPPSSLPSTAEWPGGTRAFPRWTERSRCTCAHETLPLGGTVRISRPRPVSWQLLSWPKPGPACHPSRPGSRQSVPDAGNPEMLEFALSQETARTAPLLPPVEGREENLLFRFVSVPPSLPPFPDGGNGDVMSPCHNLEPSLVARDSSRLLSVKPNEWNAPVALLYPYARGVAQLCKIH